MILGKQPLANALRTKWDSSTELRVPLEVTRCITCGLSQLTVVVDPDILYANYPFRSGTSAMWQEHCDQLASIFRCPGKVLDIGAGDGTLLGAFDKREWYTTGVDHCPAGNNIIQGSWSRALAKDLTTAHGPFDLITAQNVLGHTDNVHGFFGAVKASLTETGHCIIEVPHVGALFNTVAFDTIYHEHLTYWSLEPLQRVARTTGLSIFRVDQLPHIHGGSRRYWLTHTYQSQAEPSMNQEKASLDEVVLLQLGTFHTFDNRISTRLHALRKYLRKHKDKTLLGWGANAKSTVLLNALNTPQFFPSAIIDETQKKQGKLTPGTHIPIIAPPEDLSGVDILWVFAWNWVESIRAKAAERGFTGEILTCQSISQ